MQPQELVKKLDHKRLVEAIQRAERGAPVEVRVFISHAKPKDPMAAAHAEFRRLKLHRLPARNGVLIYLAPHTRGLAVLGDTAIHQRIGDAAWREIVDGMLSHCRGGNFTDAIVHGIDRLAAVLAEHPGKEA